MTALIILFVLLALFVGWVVYTNLALEVNGFKLEDKALPNAFAGFRIAHISDLHNASFGKGNIRLLKKLGDMRPDIIAITGDLIDSRHTNAEIALEFVREALKIAPIYYVSGNHESRLAGFKGFAERLGALGVRVLENRCERLERNGEAIAICGISDPNFRIGDASSEEEIIDFELKTLCEGAKDCGAEDDLFADLRGCYSLLLSHRPQYIDIYAKYNLNIVLCGHAHGGQLRLPFFGGLFSPEQGFFPKYDSGLYISSETSMIVSRGLGNSVFPFRINNSPEIILIELDNKN